jgi:hypothetical protein
MLIQQTGGQFEQAPGPRGSPHMPHEPAGAGLERRIGTVELTANTDSCFSSAVPAQAGQAGD